MSNKTQLLNHNERLASVIQTLQGKAAGGSGTSAETCTVTVNNQISNMGLNIKYVSADLSEISTLFLAASSSGSFTTLKNNMIHIILGNYDPDATYSLYKFSCSVNGSHLGNAYTNGYLRALVPLEDIVITLAPNNSVGEK